MSFLLRAVFISTLTFVPLAGFGSEYKLGRITIAQPWMRATPPGAQVAGGYLAVTNNGSDSDRLVGGSSPIASRVGIHEMKTENGVMHMRALTQGLEIKPGETVTLRPGEAHLMLEDVKRPLKPGERVSITLDFARAGKVNVDFPVESVGAKGPAEHEAAPGKSGVR